MEVEEAEAAIKQLREDLRTLNKHDKIEPLFAEQEKQVRPLPALSCERRPLTLAPTLDRCGRCTRSVSPCQFCTRAFPTDSWLPAEANCTLATVHSPTLPPPTVFPSCPQVARREKLT